MAAGGATTAAGGAGGAGAALGVVLAEVLVLSPTFLVFPQAVIPKLRAITKAIAGMFFAVFINCFSSITFLNSHTSNKKGFKVFVQVHSKLYSAEPVPEELSIGKKKESSGDSV